VHMQGGRVSSSSDSVGHVVLVRLLCCFPFCLTIFCFLFTSRLAPLDVGLEVYAYQGQSEIKMLVNLLCQFLSLSK
jgi:hypothetical protein